MAEDRGKLTTVVWPEVFPWLNLVTALRLAFNPRALIFAALAWVAVTAGWRVCGAIFQGAVTIPPESHFAGTIAGVGEWPWNAAPPLAAWWLPDQRALPAVAKASGVRPDVGGAERISNPVWWWLESPMVQGHLRLAAPFIGMFNPEISLGEFLFLFCCGLWELAVWSYLGGAITRLAAVALAREELLSWTFLACYAQRKWPSYFAAPLFPLFGVSLAAVPLALFGVLLRGDLGLVIAGALWFLVLLAGVFMAVLLVGLFFGFPLMWATISAEGTDAFDALSRSYAYTYQRPLLYVLYSMVAGALGMLGWIVVAIFTAAVVDLGAWGVSWLSGGLVPLETSTYLPWGSVLAHGGNLVPSDINPLSPTGELGLRLIRFWIDLAVTVATAFVFSYFWTANTAIYFLLRRHVDATEMDEVFVPDEADHGLPPLAHDAAGVPGVADAPAAGSETIPTPAPGGTPIP
ncbi:MAG TPA: hypothetical protein VMF30_16195 [Pirellulales bacterium]|nr:hypothetical protein [Pirellulales bacterium]